MEKNWKRRVWICDQKYSVFWLAGTIRWDSHTKRNLTNLGDGRGVGDFGTIPNRGVATPVRL